MADASANPPAGPASGGCPRCAADLVAITDGTGLACRRCGGLFLFRATLVAAVRTYAGSRASVYRESANAGPASPRGSGVYEPVVRYLMCPACRTAMTRQNFAGRSGVLVDTCPRDGTFFDADEARRAGDYLVAVELAEQAKARNP